jgi:AraC-like DNA-binding protein
MVEQTYRERPPSRRVAGFISSAWVQRVPPGSTPYVHREIPNGSIQLTCRIGGVPQVVGPLTGPRTEVLPAGTTVVGLRFHPGAAATVLGVPAWELADRLLDADELWGSAARVAGERLAAATTDERAVGALEELVIGRVAATGRPDPLIAEAVRRLMPWHGHAVHAVAVDLGGSERSFRRQCHVAIGVGPKALQRMLRFQGFLAHAQLALSHGRPPVGDGLARLAADVGYADQAHLSRECVRLTGATPREFLRATEEACGCGHDHEASFGPVLRSMAG